MPSSSKITDHWLSVIAIVVSVLALCIATWQGCTANNRSEEANVIAENANAAALKQGNEMFAWQKRVQQLEDESEIPNLQLLRKYSTKAGDIISTIQNVGGRPAALFSVQYAAITETGYTIDRSIPSGNRTNTIQIDWRDKSLDSPIDFLEPPILRSGEIVNVKIVPPTNAEAGSFTLHYSDGRTIGLGGFQK